MVNVQTINNTAFFCILVIIICIRFFEVIIIDIGMRLILKVHFLPFFKRNFLIKIFFFALSIFI